MNIWKLILEYSVIFLLNLKAITTNLLLYKYELIRLVLHLLLAFINVAQTIRKMYFPFTCPKKSLQNKIILITGAANGIGKELVFLLKKLNSSLILMDIDKENLNNLKIQIESDVESNCKIYTFKCDLSNSKETCDTMKLIKAQFYNIDILVLNAAMCNHENMVDCSIQKIEKLYQVNILSQYRIIKTFLPEMYTRNAGHIVATCSVAGFLPTIHESDYCATKFAMRGMLECLRCENERKNMYGIKITVVYPFAIDTNLFPGYKLANGFQNVFPVLKKEYVAKQMLNGIELEMDDVVIPKRWYLNIWLYSFLPFKSSFPLIQQTTTFEAMENMSIKRD